MSMINQWDIWLTDFPNEEDNTQYTSRPVIVLSVEPLWLLSVKVTSHKPRISDKYDIEITKWQESGLSKPSTARISKTTHLSPSNFKYKLGSLHPVDRASVINMFAQFIFDSIDKDALAVNE